MDFMTAIDIGASGLTAERTHLNVVSMNLANANTTKDANGLPYRRKQVSFKAVHPEQSFAKQMGNILHRELRGVEVDAIVEDRRSFRRVYDPKHPDANKDGYVNYPDVNVVQEMASMMTIMRSYEACASSISTTKTMFNKALELGR
ncbi:MAG: flagellar basal body rod protein FlgC [Deltaproteobacteria bacterium]|nr:MAG: flagellar basal body rod protein FlgC [Deltaproteobacteria bacterium]